MSKIKRNNFYNYEKNDVKISLVDSPFTKAAIARKNKTKKIIGWTVFAVLMFVLLLNVLFLPLGSGMPRVEDITSYDGPNPHIVFDEGVQISAHRAGGDLAPEETLMAFELCMTQNSYVDILEFDLHLTKDNRLVLLHDHTLDRTSNSVEHFGRKKVKVSEKTYAELRELNMGENFQAPDGSYPYRGLRGSAIPDNVRILDLDEILTYAKSQNENINYIIEIKDGGEAGERSMDILYQKMVEYDILEKTVVGTFQNNVTKYMDKKYPDVTRSASIAEVLDFYYAFLYNVNLSKRNVKYDVLQIPYRMLFNLGKPSMIDYAHKYDIAVQYWTINDPNEMRELAEAGADAIMTDNPEIAYRVLSA